MDDDRDQASKVVLKSARAPPPEQTRRRVVITYGTFDTLHHGHIRLLRRARELGDTLIVGLSTDEFNALKGKQSMFSYEERKRDLEAISYVDTIIPEKTWEQKAADVANYNVDVFTIGRDWEGRFDFLKKHNCQVVYLERTPDVSSTAIRTLQKRDESVECWLQRRLNR